jgi:hypothetical protein
MVARASPHHETWSQIIANNDSPRLAPARGHRTREQPQIRMIEIHARAAAQLRCAAAVEQSGRDVTRAVRSGPQWSGLCSVCDTASR